MIFGEYIEHDPAMPFQIFRRLGQQDWAGEGDVMVANLGRTMRLSGEPFYMCWWQIEGLKRIDEWEAHFRTAEGRLYMAETPVSRALRFTRNGIYDAIIGEGKVTAGLHFVEFFDSDESDVKTLRRAFTKRAKARSAGQLRYVINRIGHLAPDPGGMALWTFENYAQAEPFIRETPPADTVKIVSAGLYRSFGEEIP